MEHRHYSGTFFASIQGINPEKMAPIRHETKAYYS